MPLDSTILALNDEKLFRELCYIDGEWIGAGSNETIDVTNPATGEVLGTIPKMGAEETRRAIEAAQAAYPAWRAKTAKERASILRRWHDLMMEVTGPVVDLLQHDANVAWAKASWLGDLAMFARVVTPMNRRADDTGVPLTILTTRDHDSQLYRAQLAAIRRT